MSVNNLEKMLVQELKDLHSGETQITQTLPKLLEAAGHP